MEERSIISGYLRHRTVMYECALLLYRGGREKRPQVSGLEQGTPPGALMRELQLGRVYCDTGEQ